MVTASTRTCASLPAVSMGYSIDDGKAVIEPTSFSALVTATPGSHVLHVKCWGQKVNDQVLLNITVLAATSTDIAVATPVSGASVTVAVHADGKRENLRIGSGSLDGLFNRRRKGGD